MRIEPERKAVEKEGIERKAQGLQCVSELESTSEEREREQRSERGEMIALTQGCALIALLGSVRPGRGCPGLRHGVEGAASRREIACRHVRD